METHPVNYLLIGVEADLGLNVKCAAYSAFELKISISRV
jgi:hypothetical protein